MEIGLVYRDGVFYTASDEDYEKARRIKQNTILKCNIVKPRNIHFHRKFFALINTAWDYLTECQERIYGTKEAFRKTLTVAAGYYEPVMDMEEQRFVKAPLSIAFSSMTEDEFSELYEKVKNILFTYVLTNVSPEEFMENLSQF